MTAFFIYWLFCYYLFFPADWFPERGEGFERFHHPNIVQLLGVCTKGEPFMVVMEFHLYGKSCTLEELTGVSLSMEEFQLIILLQGNLVAKN